MITIKRSWSSPVIQVSFHSGGVSVDSDIVKFEQQLRDRISSHLPNLRWVFSEDKAKKLIDDAVAQAWRELVESVKHETAKGKL